MPIPGFSQEEFTHQGTTKVVYRKGAGPGVVVITEVPGVVRELHVEPAQTVQEGDLIALIDES